MASVNSRKYTIKCFVRDVKRIMDTEQNPPNASGIEFLLERLMESASFPAAGATENLRETRFVNIEYVRHIMKTGRSSAGIAAKVEPLLKTVRKQRYLGASRFCPICESCLREFVPFDEKEQNRRCPVCGSLERHRLVWLFMHQKTNLFTPPRKRMLHIAPEPCLASNFEGCENIDYVSANLTGYAMTRADLTQLCFPYGIFDAVYASHVLEHIPDDRGAMREIYRTLKPGGWALLQVPIKAKSTNEDATIKDPDKRKQAFGRRDHVRVYGEDYYDRLRDTGFTPHREKLFLQTIPSATQRFGLAPSEEISFCVKAS
jgi:Methyltransferase domain